MKPSNTSSKRIAAWLNSSNASAVHAEAAARAHYLLFLAALDRLPAARGQGGGGHSGRVDELFPGALATPEQISEATEERLRSAGLSRNKMLAVKDLAAKTLDGTVPEGNVIDRMNDEEIIERVSQVRGIGRWTVEMLLIFRLGRTDVLPVDDFGVRKGFQQTYRLPDMPTKQQMLKKGEKWKPWRSIASWYLWRAAEDKPAVKTSKDGAIKTKRAAKTEKSFKAKKAAKAVKPKKPRARAKPASKKARN